MTPIFSFVAHVTSFVRKYRPEKDIDGPIARSKKFYTQILGMFPNN